MRERRARKGQDRVLLPPSPPREGDALFAAAPGSEAPTSPRSRGFTLHSPRLRAAASCPQTPNSKPRFSCRNRAWPGTAPTAHRHPLPAWAASASKEQDRGMRTRAPTTGSPSPLKWTHGSLRASPRRPALLSLQTQLFAAFSCLSRNSQTGNRSLALDQNSRKVVTAGGNLLCPASTTLLGEGCFTSSSLPSKINN